MSGIVTHLEMATVDQLFEYKHAGFELDPFPGYTPDQWGIKAHNRPWVEQRMRLAPGKRIMEVGGAYSTLPKRLHYRYGVEAWVADDFGLSSGETEMWTRWGDPKELPVRNKPVKYVFEPFGAFSKSFPDEYFDHIFSVSTLEHIPITKIPDLLRDIHRCLRKGGSQVHTIDVNCNLEPRDVLIGTAKERFPHLGKALGSHVDPLRPWLDAFRDAGFQVAATPPTVRDLSSRATLVESADVVYRFYPPNNSPKTYQPSGSLLVEIEKTA
jgi:SAM-dependent methyltransferase